MSIKLVSPLVSAVLELTWETFLGLSVKYLNIAGLDLGLEEER